jgi:hypothetical protein
MEGQVVTISLQPTMQGLTSVLDCRREARVEPSSKPSQELGSVDTLILCFQELEESSSTPVHWSYSGTVSAEQSQEATLPRSRKDC